MPAPVAPRPCAGFSYVAVLLAITLLALCAAPAADAVRHAATAPAVSARQLNNLLCLKSRMEIVAAEPYHNLLRASAGPLVATSVYSLPAGDPCPMLNVYISMVSADAAGNAIYPAQDSGLLQVVVTVADPSVSPQPGPPGPPTVSQLPIARQPASLAAMSLATMLAR